MIGTLMLILIAYRLEAIGHGAAVLFTFLTVMIAACKAITRMAEDGKK